MYAPFLTINYSVVILIFTVELGALAEIIFANR